METQTRKIFRDLQKGDTVYILHGIYDETRDMHRYAIEKHEVASECVVNHYDDLGDYVKFRTETEWVFDFSVPADYSAAHYTEENHIVFADEAAVNEWFDQLKADMVK